MDRMPGRGSGLGARLRAVFGGGRAGTVEWEEAEEALIGADLGPQLAADVVAAARERAAA